jgi:hypothetical protein
MNAKDFALSWPIVILKWKSAVLEVWLLLTG